MKKFDIVIIMDASWFGRHEGKHTEYIGEPGILQKKAMANNWWYVLVMPDDEHADVALYHQSNLDPILSGDKGERLLGERLCVDQEVLNEIWAKH